MWPWQAHGVLKPGAGYGPWPSTRTLFHQGVKLTADDDRDQQIRALRERLVRLSEASLRASESLDLDTVLSEVVDSARTLAGARYGGVTLVDGSGRFQAFVTSGLSEEERQGLLDLPGGLPLFEFLSNYPEPLRLSDFSGQARTLGVTAGLLPLTTFLGCPIRHRGAHMGNFYLANKEGGREFTGEDEETLVMFASQAAAAIANARRHRDEQRARADLEALIDTCPVGVVVFDAITGQPTSVNRESRRIAGGLLGPEGSVEQVLEVLTILRADGNEISLQELSLTDLLSVGETVRAEQVVMRAPGGESVTVLLNATPIRSGNGEVESVVVTLQDMRPLEELERLRAEFLGMVSHELRVPLTSIKGATATLLDSTADLDPTEMRQFHRIIDQQAEHMRALIGELLDVARIETGALQISPEPVDVPILVDRARNTFVSGGGRNNLDMDVEPELPRVLADRRRIVQVLGNLLSNAAKHSPESSVIRVKVVRDGVHVVFSVADEGRGIPPERLPNLFRKFTGTGREDGEIGGAGLGLAICQGIVEAHGGRIWAESEGPGLGARFSFTLTAAAEDARGHARGSAQPHGKRLEGGRILVVDDDPETLRFVRRTLTEAGYEPAVAAGPEEALALMRESRPHLVLLDLILPGSDGIQLMQEILGIDNVPVIFISGYGRDQVIAGALDAGASDYIVKPFSPTELVARVGAALRKDVARHVAERYVLGDLTIDYAGRTVTVGGSPVTLTPIEYEVLYELSIRGGQAVSHDHLLQQVWGTEKPASLRTLRTHMMRLRQKLGEDVENPAYVLTEPRIGYRMPKGETPGEAEAK